MKSRPPAAEPDPPRSQGSPLARLWGGIQCGLQVLISSGAVSAPLPPATGSAFPPAGVGPYEFRQEHSRDGIGKFYLGREIAQVMGHQAADWLERQERDAEEKTELLVASLPIMPGDVVADIGAGTGYFSRRLARKVGVAGKILAVDIQPEMLDLLTNKMAELKITNVFPILGAVTNPNLPAASVDLALMVDVYHEFDHPREMMEAISKSLRPGGRVVFVEFRGEDPQVPIKPLHKMTEAQVRKEMARKCPPCRWSGSRRRRFYLASTSSFLEGFLVSGTTPNRASHPLLVLPERMPQRLSQSRKPKAKPGLFQPSWTHPRAGEQ